MIVGGTCDVTNAIVGPSKFYRLSNQLLPLNLAVLLAAGNIVLLWPTNATGFTLQSTSNLPSTPNWAAVTMGRGDNGPR